MTEESKQSTLAQVSNAMVALHKEQFGRGPTKARSDFAGRDVLVCTLEDILLPAEVKMASMGEQKGVRDTRTSFQAATAPEFISVVETITQRKVRAFASGIDVENSTAFETFQFESIGDDGTG
jgi:uncharacterized protein YbcI